MSHRRHDPSPGDAREPFSNEGGPAGKHAQTHDLRREELSNAKGPEPEGEDFSADIAPAAPDDGTGGHADESRAASGDKGLHERLDDLDGAELAQLAVLETGPACIRAAPMSTSTTPGASPSRRSAGRRPGPSTATWPSATPTTSSGTVLSARAGRSRSSGPPKLRSRRQRSGPTRTGSGRRWGRGGGRPRARG